VTTTTAEADALIIESRLATDPATTTDSDIYKGEIPSGLAITMVRALSDINPIRSAVAIGLEWGGIAVAMAVHWRFPTPFLLPVLVMWIGARQHALGILMHEGVHYHLFKNRTLNEVVSEVLLAWPLFITARAYRGAHFSHHRHVNTDKDPDVLRKQGPEWVFPKSWRALGVLLLKDAVGLNTYQQLMESADLAAPKGVQTKRMPPYRIAKISYYLSILGLVTYFGVWPAFILLWMVPLLTWLKVILRIRSIAEHYAVENDHVYTRTRTTLPSVFERMFVAPRNINYHIEHHLYPSVPFFRLPRLHALMMEDVEFKSKAHLTSTYWGVLCECVGGRPAGRA
jgi:fatty acid desaturase